MTPTLCQQCQREIAGDFEFCPYCGAVSRCGKCRVKLASDYTFCPHCGANVDAFDIVGVSSQNPQAPAPPAPAPQEPVLHAPTRQEPTGDIGIGTAELPVMSFSNAVKLGFQKYFDFSGRATRAEFWWWVLFTVLVNTGFTIVQVFTGPDLYHLIYTVLFLVLFIPTTALWTRRLHDINRTGWWQLMWLGGVFIIPLIVLIWWFMKRGHGSFNKYGPAPRQAAWKGLLGVWEIVGLILLCFVVQVASFVVVVADELLGASATRSLGDISGSVFNTFTSSLTEEELDSLFPSPTSVVTVEGIGLSQADIAATVEARVELAKASLIAPTAAPLPTYTPLPTHTPMPTYTPVATPTQDYEALVEARLAKERDTPLPTYRDNILKITYDELFRNNENYVGQLVRFQGSITQVVDSGGAYVMRVFVTLGEWGLWEDDLYLVYSGPRLLKSDLIEFTAMVEGLHTYETIWGAERTIPSLTAIETNRITDDDLDRMPSGMGQSGIGQSRANPMPVGSTLVTPAGLAITVLSLNPDAWSEIAAQNKFLNEPPGSDNRYLLVGIEVENVGGGSEAISVSVWDFKVAGSSALIIEEGCSYNEIPDAIKAVEFYKGGKINGNLCFEVGDDETSILLGYSFMWGEESWLMLGSKAEVDRSPLSVTATPVPAP